VLASSLDFLQGAFEKIDFQCFVRTRSFSCAICSRRSRSVEFSRGCRPSSIGSHRSRHLYNSRGCTPSSLDNARTLSQPFSRSTAIFRKASGYRPIARFFATRSSFPCKVCPMRLFQFRGSLHWRTPMFGVLMVSFLTARLRYEKAFRHVVRLARKGTDGTYIRPDIIAHSLGTHFFGTVLRRYRRRNLPHADRMQTLRPKAARISRHRPRTGRRHGTRKRHHRPDRHHILIHQRREILPGPKQVPHTTRRPSGTTSMAARPQKKITGRARFTSHETRARRVCGTSRLKAGS
jgi:hypothetical protein